MKSMHLHAPRALYYLMNDHGIRFPKVLSYKKVLVECFLFDLVASNGSQKYGTCTLEYKNSKIPPAARTQGPYACIAPRNPKLFSILQCVFVERFRIRDLMEPEESYKETLLRMMLLRTVWKITESCLPRFPYI